MIEYLKAKILMSAATGLVIWARKPPEKMIMFFVIVGSAIFCGVTIGDFVTDIILHLTTKAGISTTYDHVWPVGVALSASIGPGLLYGLSKISYEDLLAKVRKW